MYNLSTLKWLIIISLIFTVQATPALSANGSDVQNRITMALKNGSPIVVPDSNLYWGALYGIRNFFVNKAGWRLIEKTKSGDDRILERLILYRSVLRNGQQASVSIHLAAGGNAHLLACDSRSYFLDKLNSLGVHPLLFTTGLMAPEAYTLEAAICTWASGELHDAVMMAAADSYNTYQKCGRAAARRLFWGAP